MLYNDLPPFKKNTTCAVSGHRILGADFNAEKLYNDLENIIKSGYNIFLIGMAVGFDMQCFSALTRLKEKYENIKLAAIIPCLNQSEKYGFKNKKLYAQMVAAADYKAILGENYEKNCMYARNDYLLENSSLLYAYYLNTNRGGTLYTINRAKKRGMNIILY